MTEAETRLRALLDERIVVLDGAWGVLLQGRGLSEEDFRGERFSGHDREVKGDPDLLNLTRPEIVSEIHRAYFDAGADITTTNTFTATSIAQADYGLQDAVYDMNVAGARLAREAAALGPDRLRRRLGRPAQRDALDLAQGRRPVVPHGQLRRGARGLRGADPRPASTAASTCCWSRRSSTPSTPRPRSLAAKEVGARAAALDLGHDHRPQRAHALRPDDRGVLDSRSSTPSRSASGSTARSGPREMRPYVAELARIAPTYVSCYPNAGLPNAFGGYDEAAEDHAQPPGRVRRRRARQHRRRLLRHDARAHPGRLRTRSGG